MPEESKSAKDVADKMIERLRTGKNIHDLFAEQVKTRILIQGKTMEQWKKHFTVKIPETPDINECRNLDMKIMALHEEAAFLKAMAEASHTLGKRSHDSAYREKFTSLVSEYKAENKKLPAKDTLETLAKAELDDIESGLSYSELSIKFWKEILEDLNFKRRVIENATINNSVEAKLAEKNINPKREY